MPHVTIIKPRKTATQSGKAKTKHWQIVFNADQPGFQEPLMGWTGAGDTWDELDLKFQSLESAIQFAEQHGYAYTLVDDAEARIPPKSYSDNFRFNKIRNKKGESSG